MKDHVTRKIAALVSRRGLLSESEVSHLMTLCRKSLEHLPRKERERYPILKFFCNWALHITLDKSLEGMAILKRLNDTLVELAPGADNDVLTSRITEIVSFRQLRREMAALLGYLQVRPTIVNDQERWVTFANHLIEIVRDCPLIFGENLPRKARALYASITENPLRGGSWVVGVSVVEVNYGQLSSGDPSGLFCLCVRLSDTTRIVIPMAREEVVRLPY